jgi:dTMP kinase
MIISFEGIDGSGKSTQAGMLVDSLRASGRTVHLVREPGGTPVSERIRRLLLDPGLEIDAFAEMLLYSAARAQLVRGHFEGMQGEGALIVCDRFFDSTVAYQGGGRRIADLDWLDGFQRQVTGGVVPDRTYLIRVSLETALSRQADRTADRMERSDRSFFERVIKAYDDLAEKNRTRIKVIDGEPAAEQVAQAVLKDLESLPAFVDRARAHGGTRSGSNG